MCFGAWAQSPAADDDAAKHDALLRALHATEDATNANAANTNAAPVTASTNSVPPAPEEQPAPRHKRHNSSAPAAATNDPAVTVVNATTIDVSTPSGSAGSVAVSVATAGGTGTDDDAFTYVTPPPSLTGVLPSSGTTAGGTAVVLAGTNLSGATAIDFGASAATAVKAGTCVITASMWGGDPMCKR